MIWARQTWCRQSKRSPPAQPLLCRTDVTITEVVAFRLSEIDSTALYRPPPVTASDCRLTVDLANAVCLSDGLVWPAGTMHVACVTSRSVPIMCRLWTARPMITLGAVTTPPALSLLALSSLASSSLDPPLLPLYIYIYIPGTRCWGDCGPWAT